jgi:transketolase
VETAEAWELALTVDQDHPSILALSRQNLRHRADHPHGPQNLSAQGAYVLAEAEGKRQVILMATGSEVEIALAAKHRCSRPRGSAPASSRSPAWELFAAQDDSYRRRVLPAGAVRVAIEAGVRFGWDRWLFGEGGRREKAGFIGMHDFGASAPAEVLYKEFGITAEATAAKVKSLLG